MNKLPLAKRVQILSMLCEGSSMRSISRVADVSISTLSKLLAEAGEACLAIHDETVRNVKASRIEADEIWSFCYSKQANVAKAKDAPEGAGDVWTWTALDAETKLIVSYFVGDRLGQSAIALMDDLRDRISNRVQLTTDGHRAYLERQNLTMRMSMRRFTRLTNAFSKKLDNHIHALALYFAFYNFCRVHKTLRMSPAMAAGVTDRLWSLEDIVARIDTDAPAPKPRGPYKKRAA